MIVKRDQKECGCHISMNMVDTVSTSHKIQYCANHDPGFCDYKSFYGRSCWKLKHTDQIHANKEGVLPESTERQINERNRSAQVSREWQELTEKLKEARKQGVVVIGPTVSRLWPNWHRADCAIYGKSPDSCNCWELDKKHYNQFLGEA